MIFYFHRFRFNDSFISAIYHAWYNFINTKSKTLEWPRGHQRCCQLTEDKRFPISIHRLHVSVTQRFRDISVIILNGLKHCWIRVFKITNCKCDICLIFLLICCFPGSKLTNENCFTILCILELWPVAGWNI